MGAEHEPGRETGRRQQAAPAENAPAPTADTGDDDQPRVPHPFFYWCLLAAVAGIIAAAVLETADAPRIALGSEWLYRAEVAGFVFLILYAVGVFCGFAIYGKVLVRIDFPTGGGIEPPNEGDLNKAASDIEEMVDGEGDRYERLSKALRRMDERVTELEGGGKP